MNKEKAINSFMKNASNLSRLPLITDSEMLSLFGEEVAAVLSRLATVNQKEDSCRSCTDKCCRIIKCELFSAHFAHCPIHDFRPVICRLHYCLRFPPENDEAIKDLADMLLESLSSAERAKKIDTTLFDAPPLAEGCPELMAVAGPLVRAVEGGTIDPELAAQLISREAEKYRIKH